MTGCVERQEFVVIVNVDGAWMLAGFFWMRAHKLVPSPMMQPPSQQGCESELVSTSNPKPKQSTIELQYQLFNAVYFSLTKSFIVSGSSHPRDANSHLFSIISLNVFYCISYTQNAAERFNREKTITPCRKILPKPTLLRKTKTHEGIKDCSRKWSQ